MFIEVNGIKLYYEKIGFGDPLIMIHGNGESHEIFYEAADILKEYYEVYLIDSRGHGLSDKIDEFHYQDMADDIKEFVISLKIEKPIYFGFSDGGILGLLLAIQTNLFRQYIVCGTNSNLDAVKWYFKILCKVMYWFNKSPLFKLMLTEPDIPESELRRITTEVDIISGEKDLIPRSHTRYLHEVIPNSKIEIIKGHSHGSYIIHKTDVADLILKYTNKI